MWPFSKKWTAPAPRLAMVVSLQGEKLPSPLMLANPAGHEGALAGMLGPADQQPSEETMAKPMQEGQYAALSPGQGYCSLQVKRVDPRSFEGLSLGPEFLEASGLTPETLAKYNRPTWEVALQMEAPAADVSETVLFVTRLARRLAALGDGIAMDVFACRFFGPAGWPVEEPIGELDAREHVHVHIESDTGWLHTHGLIKFGRPEMEIYDVPAEMYDTAFLTLLNLAQYVMGSALIEPGQTCGDPNQPFYAREGNKNPDGHWDNMPVLELVDVNEFQKPVSSGAPKALQAFAAG